MPEKIGKNEKPCQETRNYLLNPDGSIRTNANEALIYREVRPLTAILQADGNSYLYHAEGVYIYALRYPVEDGDTVWAGAVPTQTHGPELLTLGGLVFDRSLLRSLPLQGATLTGATPTAIVPQGSGPFFVSSWARTFAVSPRTSVDDPYPASNNERPGPLLLAAAGWPMRARAFLLRPPVKRTTRWTPGEPINRARKGKGVWTWTSP